MVNPHSKHFSHPNVYMSFHHSKDVTIIGSSVTYVAGNLTNIQNTAQDACLNQLCCQQDPAQSRLHNTVTTFNEAPTQTNSMSKPFPPSQPVPPEIFFGRDDIVSDYVSLITRNDQTRLAILGSGGMGKTSTSLHILHHPDVVTRYRDHRYFVGCDAVTSAEALAALILQIIQGPLTAGENVVTILHRAFISAPLTLLLLDNFETVWNINSRRDRIVDLLQKVVNATSVSLIITMRGTIPPSGIAWTRFGCLPQLLPADSKRTFLAINPSLNNGECRDEESLDTLLAEMDHVPLAVQLLAHVSIGFSPQYMLKRWTEKKTAMLRMHEGTPGKLESVEVSIELSLAPFDIKGNPEAVQLLGILCQLPDGLHEWEERLPIVAARLHDVHHLVHLLHKTALVFIAGSVLKVLSPIRHFINHHHEAESDHIQVLENYFWNLIRTHATTPFGPDFCRAKGIMEPDMGNICSLIKSAAHIRASTELVEIVLAVSGFQFRTVPSTELLCDVMQLVKHVQSATQEARILWRLGNMLFIQAKYTEASETVKEARRQFFNIGDVVHAVYCSQRLGEALRMQAKYTEASEILTEAQRQFIEIGEVLGAAQCSQSLGDILRMQAKYTEASDTLTEARRQFINVGSAPGAAHCSTSLGNILCIQAKYTEASQTLTEAQSQFIGIGDVFGTARCSLYLGTIFYKQGRYTEASETLTEARKEFLNIGVVVEVTDCSRCLGDILTKQNSYAEAFDTLTEARQQFLDIGYLLGATQCSRSLGKILFMQHKYAEASDVLTEARQQFITYDNAVSAAECSTILDDIYCTQAHSI